MSPPAPRRVSTVASAPGQRAPSKKAPANKAPSNKAPATKGTAPEVKSRVDRDERLGSPGTGVLVTGAASGIGQATARAFGREGARVALDSNRRQDDCRLLTAY